MRSSLFLTKVEQAPDNLLFRFSLAQALYQENNYEEACEHLQVCCDGRKDWMLAKILLGKSLLALGKTDDARPVLQAALALAIEQNHDDPADELRTLLAADTASKQTGP